MLSFAYEQTIIMQTEEERIKNQVKGKKCKGFSQKEPNEQIRFFRCASSGERMKRKLCCIVFCPVEH